MQEEPQEPIEQVEPTEQAEPELPPQEPIEQEQPTEELPEPAIEPQQKELKEYTQDDIPLLDELAQQQPEYADWVGLQKEKIGNKEYQQRQTSLGEVMREFPEAINPDGSWNNNLPYVQLAGQIFDANPELQAHPRGAHTALLMAEGQLARQGRATRTQQQKERARADKFWKKTPQKPSKAVPQKQTVKPDRKTAHQQSMAKLERSGKLSDVQEVLKQRLPPNIGE